MSVEERISRLSRESSERLSALSRINQAIPGQDPDQATNAVREEISRGRREDDRNTRSERMSAWLKAGGWEGKTQSENGQERETLRDRVPGAKGEGGGGRTPAARKKESWTQNQAVSYGREKRLSEGRREGRGESEWMKGRKAVPFFSFSVSLKVPCCIRGSKHGTNEERTVDGSGLVIGGDGNNSGAG